MVIVTDPHLRTSLCVIRSLGRRGIEVNVLKKKNTASITMGELSKYCKGVIYYKSGENNWLESVNQRTVLIPMSEASIGYFSKKKEDLKRRIRLLIPDFESFELARNKDKLLRLSIKIGCPVPQSFFVNNLREVNKLKDEVNYPCIIKVRNEERIEFCNRYIKVNTREEFVDSYLKVHKIQELPLIQEYIEGEPVGFFALYDEKSKVKAVFAHRRLRESRPTGGPSTFCEGINYNYRNIGKYGLKLLKALKWKGVAMVEFRIDKRDNVPKLMEVNPRFWGSTPLAIHSGVDFPYLLYKLACREEFPQIFKYKIGKKVRFLYADLHSFRLYVKYLKRKRRFSFICRFLRDFLNPSIKEGLFEWDDLPSSIHIIKESIFSDISKLFKKIGN